MAGDMALLCCIPLEEEEWNERFASAQLGDFVRSNAEAKGGNDPDKTWQLFSAEASFIRRKLEALAHEGIAVVLHATATDIRESAMHFKDIVVIAHWKHERVFKSDILSPVSLWTWMLQVDPAMQRLGLSAEDALLADKLRDIIDGLVVHGGSDLVAFSAGADGRLPASVLRRDALNTIPHLAPGNRIETWDAMLSAEQFSELFGPRFEGTALMAICYSILLAETFRLRHPNAICICNKETANAGLNLAKLGAAVSLARKKRLPLWQALNQAGDMIDSLAH
jgi:hypothetical protein